MSASGKRPRKQHNYASLNKHGEEDDGEEPEGEAAKKVKAATQPKSDSGGTTAAGADANTARCAMQTYFFVAAAFMA